MKNVARQIPLHQWPELDRIAWNKLFADGDIFDETIGHARHWRPATRKSNLKHYASWLGWLIDTGRLDKHVRPEDRATLENVRAYSADLMDGRSKRTVATYLIGLKCVLIRMVPGKDWQWLRELTTRLDVWAGNPEKPYPSPLSANEMFAIVLAELERLKSIERTKLTHRLAYRDTLIVGFLLSCPVRLANLTQIEIGRHLQRAGDEWFVTFDGSETKNYDPVTYIVASAIVPHLVHYVETIRPAFGTIATDSTRLWLAIKKAPLAENTLYQRIVALTGRLFGAPISPHQFRSIAATFLAETSAADSLRARPLLGHRSGDTTATHYIRASSIEASRNVAAALVEIGKSPRAAQGNRAEITRREKPPAAPIKKAKTR
jgi:integrase/recombinase XerD